MTKHDYKQNAYYMLYLIRCVIHNMIPEKEKLDKMNLLQLYEVSEAHSLTAITAYALESAGIYDETFKQAKSKAIRKNIVLDIERSKVLAEFEKASIWYMPLKGSVLKDLYPKIGMRQMADNDILCDEHKMDKVKEVMERCGFTTVVYGKSHQDVYKKLPVCNFEMHSRLFEPRHRIETYTYYNSIKEKLVKDKENNYGYHFSIDDFYVFMIAHEYKHFYGTGTGLRSLLDTFIFLKEYSEQLNWSYIFQELNKLNMSEFEINNRSLALDLFGNHKLSYKEKELLDYYIFSGTYGVLENRIYNSIGKRPTVLQKIRYANKRAMVPETVMKEFYPFFYKHRILRPFLYSYKVIHKLFINPSVMFTEIRHIICYKR